MDLPGPLVDRQGACDEVGERPRVVRFADDECNDALTQIVVGDTDDRGLADLSILNVMPRRLTSKDGKNQSWLVSVEIRNAGAVEAEVPVTVRSGALTTTDRVKIGPQSSLSTRIVFQGTPADLVASGTSLTAKHLREYVAG